MDELVYNDRTRAIFALLDASGVAYSRQHHAAVDSSEHAAKLRGVPLAMGGKSLLFKIGKRPDFRLLVISAAQRTDGRLIRKHFGVQKMRFARTEELMAHTGLRPGCVPPFGRPIFDLPVYVEAELAAREEIAFTAADHRISVRMKVADYLAVAKVDGVFSFCR